MRKKVFSLLMALYLALSLFPSAALASASYTLYVGNTRVYDNDTRTEGTTYYWKALEGGDYAYADTGTANDYLFSVSFDGDSNSFTLTLNGVNITTTNDGNNGVYSNTALNVVLADGSSNSVSSSGDAIAVGDSGSVISISGGGSLTVTAGAGSSGIYSPNGNISIAGGTVTAGGNTGISASEGSITISGGTVTAAGSQNGIWSHSGVTISDGSLMVTATNTHGQSIYSGGPVSVTASPYKFRTNTSATAPESPYTLFPGTAFANSGDYKYLEIISCPKVYVSGDNANSGTVKVSGVTNSGHISYWLNNGSGSITNTGADADSYNVKYNEATQTLTLKDANITSFYSDGEHYYGIYAQGNLNLVLEGSSVIGTAEMPVGTAGIKCGGELSISAASGGSLSIVSDENGIDARYGLSIDSSTVTITAEQRGVYASSGGFYQTDGEVSVTSGEAGIVAGSNIKVTGAQTILTVTACAATDSIDYGISSSNNILITDAAVRIIKNGIRGDAVRARYDIRISGGANVAIVDWSSSDGDGCGLHSNVCSVAIGGGSRVGVFSRSIGIYTSNGFYLGYVLDGSNYTASGRPTVKINDPDSVAAITPGTPDDFAIGSNGIRVNGSIYMADGSLTAVGSVSALCYGEEGSLTLPSSYKHKSNTVASDPGGSGTYGTYTYSENDKYLEIITGAAPIVMPSRTITVTETSSELFNGAPGAVRAEANMTNAFSNSVEVKVTDTSESAANFGLGAGNTVYPFDISLYIKGTDTKTQPAEGYAVTIYLPIPETMLDNKEQLSVVHKSDSGAVSVLPSRLVQVNGVWYLVFEATEFSPYALAVNSMDTYDEAAGLPYYLDSAGNRLFIGFTANGKYIAPAGAEVSAAENSKSFSDISGHWATDYVGFVTEREIFLGTGDGAFSPNSGMTRAMFAAVIGRLYERSFGGIEAASTNTFTDCDYDEYYGKYVDWAAKNGIIGGYGDGLFGPGDMITREQMAAILYRFADFLGALPCSIDAALNYSDAASISSYAKNAALYCQTTSIITGREGSCFAPGETASRAEVAAVVERFVETITA